MNWLRRQSGWSDRVIQRALAIPWMRRPMMLAVGLVVAAYPIWVAWSLGVDRDFTATNIGKLVSAGVSFGLCVATFASLAPTLLGVGRVQALIVLVPVIGGACAIWWFWELSDVWPTRNQRQ